MKNARHIRLSSCASAEIPAQPLNSCAPRRLLSGALAVLVVLLFCPSILVNAVETNLTAYSKAYTIENILSDYQYFVSGDLTLGEHNVGAIACGGSATIGNFGDGAIAPSYIQNVLSIKNYNGGGYLSSYPEFSAYVGLPAYYKTAAGNTANMKLYDKGTSYIDFTSAFASLKSQSSSMASAVTNSHTATADDITGDIYNGFTLNLTFSGYENAIIPADIYNQINYIKLSGITSLEDLINKRYVVNVSGITNPSITFKYISYSESNASGTKGILYSDGQPFNNTNSIKNMPGTIQAGQMSMNGMKLVWNFPDADTVTTNYTAGHIVAPNADVTIESGTGNFEGGVIAQSVNNPDGEGHFYPYVAVGESSDPGVTTSPTIKLIKTDSGTTPLTGATFGLFSNADCTEAHR
ncbi:collagen-binding domain-containing protein, partial [Acetanaerobacterium elongatum]